MTFKFQNDRAKIRFEGTRRATDVMLSYRRNHRPRGQQWSVSLPKIFLEIALCYSIIVVLTVEIGMARPSNYLGHDALFGQTIRRPASEWTGRYCTYEGNCPTLSFCGASGRCMPYLTREQVEAMPEVRLNGTALGPSEMTNVSTCVQQCIQDAVWDERYYFLSMANVIGAMEHSASGADAPEGCVVIYRRSSSGEAQPTTDEWQQNRAGALVRRDPVPEFPGGVGEQQRWAVLCYNPCETDAHCVGTASKAHYSDRSTDPASFQCDSGHCRRTNKRMQSNYAFGRDDILDYRRLITTSNHTAAPSDLVVLSYANHQYFGGLRELAASLRYWAPHARLCVYNLGLNAGDMNEMDSWSNLIDIVWRDGFPDYIPKHAKVGKVYAWKPIAIAEAAKRFGKILVFDGGSVIRGPLDPLEVILEQTGNFVVWGQDTDMMEKAHPSSFKWFNYTKETFVGGPSYSGNTQGYLYPSDSYDNIVVPMLSCALNASCIQPAGSTLGNHRYDQTVLSIVAYQFHVMAQPHTEYLAASNPGSNFLQPVQKLVWTARQGSRNYANAGY